MSQSSIHENLIRRMIYCYSTGNFEDIPNIIHPDYNLNDYYDPAVKGTFEPNLSTRGGVEGWITRIGHAREMIPDLKGNIDHMISNENEVWIKVTVTGIHSGEFGPIKPTNNKIKYTWAGRYEFKDGKIFKADIVIDKYDQLMGLGILSLNNSEVQIQGYINHLKSKGLL